MINLNLNDTSQAGRPDGTRFLENLFFCSQGFPLELKQLQKRNVCRKMKKFSN